MIFISKNRNLAPLAGAALLALSPFSRPAFLAAAETSPTPASSAAQAQKVETRYNSSDLIALLKFVDVVATCNEVCPSNGYRHAVVSQLAKNGTLSALSLLPEEQAILLQVARYGTSEVQTSIIAARLNMHGARAVY